MSSLFSSFDNVHAMSHVAMCFYACLHTLFPPNYAINPWRTSYQIVLWHVRWYFKAISRHGKWQPFLLRNWKFNFLSHYPKIPQTMSTIQYSTFKNLQNECTPLKQIKVVPFASFSEVHTSTEFSLIYQQLWWLVMWKNSVVGTVEEVEINTMKSSPWGAVILKCLVHVSTC
jgi:hypothetical protein